MDRIFFNGIMILVCIAVAGTAIECGHGDSPESQRMTLDQFTDEFASAYLEAGKDSAGYDAMGRVARNYDHLTMELTGQITWERSYDRRPESQDIHINSLTYGDLIIDSTNTGFYFDWLKLIFQNEKRPHIKPDLIEYGLNDTVPYYPFGLSGHYAVTTENDTIEEFDIVVVRGQVHIDWEHAFQNRHTPLQCISLIDCELIDILPPCE